MIHGGGRRVGVGVGVGIRAGVITKFVCHQDIDLFVFEFRLDREELFPRVCGKSMIGVDNYDIVQVLPDCQVKDALLSLDKCLIIRFCCVQKLYLLRDAVY